MSDESDRSLLESESEYLIPVSADVEASPPRPIQLLPQHKGKLYENIGRRILSPNMKPKKATTTINNNDLINYMNTHTKEQVKTSASSDAAVLDSTAPRRFHLPQNIDADNVTRWKAVTMLQALWRGWYIRNRDPYVRQLLQRLRAKRSDDHIRFLRSELDRVISLYEQEQKLRNLQVEAIKYLWKEVKSLQKWRSKVTGVPVTGSNGKNDSKTFDLSFSSDQDKTCAELTQQVHLLQKSVATLTNYVFHGTMTDGSMAAAYDDAISVTAVQQEALASLTTGTIGDSSWDVIQTSPDEQCRPCPVSVSVRGVSDDRALLSWSVTEKPGAGDTIGYRIYVNDKPRSMLSPIHRNALIKGLKPEATYRLHIRTVSALSDLADSATITIAKFRQEFVQQSIFSPEKSPVSMSRASLGERSPPDDTTPSHTPKIMHGHQKTREHLLASSPDSEDSNKENVIGEPVRSHKKTRSLDKFTQIQVMPDKPEQMKKKSEEHSSPKNTITEQQAMDMQAAALARRKDRTRSISLSEALSGESSESAELMKKSSSSSCLLEEQGTGTDFSGP